MENNFISKDLNFLFITKTKSLLPLPLLLRSVLRYVYDQKSMSRDDISDMMNSMTNWFEWLNIEKDKMAAKYGVDYVYKDTRPVGTKGTSLDEIEFQLSGFAWILRENDQGRFEARKAMFKEHGIDYRKFYKLPEAYNSGDFIKAKEYLKKAMEDNPEDYN